MKILVMGRESAERYIGTEKYAVISVTSPYSEWANLKDDIYRIDVLRLTFHDWNERGQEIIEKQNTPEAKRMIFFTTEHAKRIVEFIKFLYLCEDPIKTLVVHCEAGISRSAGIAAAISKCLYDNDEYYFKHYLPNSLVYSTIVNIWNENV